MGKIILKPSADEIYKFENYKISPDVYKINNIEGFEDLPVNIVDIPVAIPETTNMSIDRFNNSGTIEDVGKRRLNFTGDVTETGRFSLPGNINIGAFEEYISDIQHRAHMESIILKKYRMAVFDPEYCSLSENYKKASIQESISLVPVMQVFNAPEDLECYFKVRGIPFPYRKTVLRKTTVMFTFPEYLLTDIQFLRAINEIEFTTENDFSENFQLYFADIAFNAPETSLDLLYPSNHNILNYTKRNIRNAN